MSGYVVTKTGEWVLDYTLDTQGIGGQGDRQNDSALIVDAESGTQVNPSETAFPAAGDQFHVVGGSIGRIRFALPSTATASETVTVTWYLRNGTTATQSSTLAIGEEDWAINLLGLDYLTWSSTGSSATLEIL